MKREPPPGRKTRRGLCCESLTRSIECVEDSVRKESREGEWEGRNRSSIVSSSEDERTADKRGNDTDAAVMTGDLTACCHRRGISKPASEESRKGPDSLPEQYRAERGKDDDTEALEEIQIPGIPSADARIERMIKDRVK